MAMIDQPGGTDRVLRVAMWSSFAFLTAVGITAAIARTVSVATGGLSYSQVSQMLPPEAVQEGYAFERWFAAYPLLTFMHVIPGGLLLALAPLQFSSRIRDRYVRFHRWSGRVLIVAAFLVGLSGLLLASVFPYGGPAAAAAAFVAGAVFLIALSRAFAAIRRRDVPRHREWMIRMLALGLAIATIRVIGLFVLAITGTSFQRSAGTIFWIGWIITFTTAELWIRHTRPERVAVKAIPVTATEA